MTSVPPSELRDRIAAAPSKRRQHLAERWSSRDGTTIRCKCGNYEPIIGTVREQEDAHRAHRVAMGETVKPRALTKVERLEAELDRLRAGAVEREALLTEARDALEAAGQNGAHGDDWPAVAPAIRALAADRDRLRAELEQARQQTAAVLALLPADPAEDINAPFIPLRRIRAAASGT